MKPNTKHSICTKSTKRSFIKIRPKILMNLSIFYANHQYRWEKSRKLSKLRRTKCHLMISVLSLYRHDIPFVLVAQPSPIQIFICRLHLSIFSIFHSTRLRPMVPIVVMAPFISSIVSMVVSLPLVSSIFYRSASVPCTFSTIRNSRPSHLAPMAYCGK